MAVALSLAWVCAAPASAYAAETSVGDVVLADFESVESLQGITLAAPVVDKASQSSAFASRGNGSLRFDIAGSAATGSTIFPRVWLQNGTALAPATWRQSTYLRVGVLNSSPEPTTLYVVVRDMAGRYHQTGLSAAAFTYRVFQIRTADIAAAGVDLERLQHIQVSAARSPNPRVVHVDDVRLADTVVNEAAEQDRIAPQVIASMGLPAQVDAASAQLDQVERRIPATPAAPDAALRGVAGELRDQLDTFATRIPLLDKDVAAAREIYAGLEAARWQIARLDSVVDARKARPQESVGIGFADSMSLVFPRDLPCQCTWRDAEVELARGEFESLQLVALPYSNGLSDARVTVTAVRGPDQGGSGLRVTAHPVASLDMRPPVASVPATPTAYRPSIYQGWTPDPILTDRASVDVSGDDMQAFWIQIKSDRNAKPGQYKLDLELSATGLPAQRVMVKVTVWDVTIDDRPALRTAIGNDPKAYAEPYGITDPDGIRKLNEQKWSFLADFKIQPDNIYRSIYDSDPPTVDELRAIAQKYGGLRQFNIWYFDPRLFDLQRPDTWNAQADVLFDRIQPFVDSYRAAGLIDYAYLYCCDESLGQYTEVIKSVLTRFKARFGDIEVLTTAIDDLMGSQTGLDDLMDWWVRDVPWLSPQIVEQRHRAGKESWWYVHAGNRNPYPNVFVGYDPGQIRTMLGPMSFQAKIDGFLYYRVDRWYGHPVLTNGPLSTWDPRMWNNMPGDGSLFYPGKDGPLASVRLHNFRDGMEDYNLLTELRHALEAAPDDSDPAAIAEAQRLLSAAAVVTSQLDYVRNPASYRVWRGQVGDIITVLR